MSLGALGLSGASPAVRSVYAALACGLGVCVCVPHSSDYIEDVEPLVNKFVSVPKDYGSLNCAAFIAGVIHGVLLASGFVRAERGVTLAPCGFRGALLFSPLMLFLCVCRVLVWPSPLVPFSRRRCLCAA